MKASVYTVGQINSYIKNMFQQDYLLSSVYVKGEVSNCKYHSSGHIYFTLKDESGTISCIMFAGQRKGLAFSMKEGDRVIVFGSVSIYERDGKYQIYASKIQMDGEGDLYLRYQKLKQELEEMGMFAPEYKQKIPVFCKKIGIVTASTGAAIRDIIHIAKRRNPYVQLILYPAIVQGEKAVSSIVKGIHTLDDYGVDVIIVGRGGGSIEDLWAFNEEAVARAIFQCATPVISAVGHETDFTIADFVADLRAPTPSAAAELVVFEYDSLKKQLDSIQTSMTQKMNWKLQQAKSQFQRMQLLLKQNSAEYRLKQNQQYLAELEDRIFNAMERIVTKKRHYLEVMIGKLEGLSPLQKLSQGYAFVTDGAGDPVYNIDKIKKEDTLLIHIKNGSIEAKVLNKKKIEREEMIHGEGE